MRITFEEFNGNKEDTSPDYQQVNCHMIFDIKMEENLRRKSRMVAGVHTMTTTSSITHSLVVSRYSVRIVIIIATLNGLKVLGCDIQKFIPHS